MTSQPPTEPPSRTTATGPLAAALARGEAEGLRGIELQTNRVEVRLSRARTRARLFGRRPQTTQLGRFVVLERVGAGGMGIVYKAYDPQLDRRVALKVLRTDVVRERWPALRESLVREARAMARLSHPNVVTVFDVGTQDDEIFVAMEFVEAPTLRRWLAEPHRTVDAILDVFVQAGHGLAAAHEAGLVHRDFKPENVLVPEGAPVRVTDFGLARVLDETAARSGLRPVTASSRTATLAQAGTPAYMAPEQRRGKAVDARTDQFAFCVALFEALTGARPWSNAGDHPDDGEPPPLIERDGIDRRVAEAIARGLATAPGERFESMGALLAVLRPPPRQRWRVLALGGLALLAAGTAVGASLMREPQCPLPTDKMAGVWDTAARNATRAAFDQTGQAYASTAWPKVSERLDDYRDTWLNKRQQACQATANGEQSTEALDLRIACFERQRTSLRALTGLLQRVDASGLEHAVDSTLALPDIAACDDAIALRDNQHPPPPEVAARVAERQDDLAQIEAEFALARYEQAATALERLLPHARELDYSPLLARALAMQGKLAATTADTERALAAFDEALTLAGQLRDHGLSTELALDRLDAIVARSGETERAAAIAESTHVLLAAAGAPAAARGRLRLAEGRIAYRQGDYAGGLDATREAIALIGQGSDAQQVELAKAIQQVGTLLYSQGHLDEAHEHGEQALALRQRLLGADHPAVAQSLANLAAIALTRREVDRARDLFSQAADIQRAALGNRHPALARTLSNVCTTHHEGGRYEQAVTTCRESVEVGQAARGPDDPSLGPLLLNLASAQQQAGQRSEAQATYERAQPLLERSIGAEHPQYAVLLANLGRLHAAATRYEQAEGLFARAASLREQKLGPDHPSTLRAHAELAGARLSLGRLDVAERDLDAALARIETVLGPDHLHAADPLINLGKLAMLRGQPHEARLLFERALALRQQPPQRDEDVAEARAHLSRALSHDPAEHDRSHSLACLAAPELSDTPDMAELRRWATDHCT